MITEKSIKDLTFNQCDVLTSYFVNMEDEKILVKKVICSYINDENGVARLRTNEPEDIVNAVLAFWESAR